MENDFGFVHIPDAPAPEQAATKKSASKVNERSIVKKEKVGDAVASTGGDIATSLSVGQPLDPNRVAGLANSISSGLSLNVPDLGIGDLLNQYAKPLAELGLLGFAGKKILGGGNSNAPVQPPEAKPDMRNFGQAPIAPAAPAIPAEASIPKGWEDIIAKSEANAAAKAADAAAKANPLPVGAAAGVPGAMNPMDQLTAQPAAYPLIQKPVVGSMPDGAPEAIVPPPPAAAAAPEAPVAPQQTLKQAVETGGDVGKALKTDVAGMVDQAAGVAPPLTKPQQGMKNWLLNQYGGKDLPMAHEAYDQVKQILGYTPAYQEGSRGGSLMPEEKGKILDWRKEALPGPKVNLTHDMKKVLKVGGPALAALIATTEFANAKTAQDKASAGTNLLGAILPLGMDINAAGAPGVQQSQISQAALLGSPYAQTEWAKTQRLRERAGAGRGIAPPSAYQR